MKLDDKDLIALGKYHAENLISGAGVEDGEKLIGDILQLVKQQTILDKWKKSCREGEPTVADYEPPTVEGDEINRKPHEL